MIGLKYEGVFESARWRLVITHGYSTHFNAEITDKMYSEVHPSHKTFPKKTKELILMGNDMFVLREPIIEFPFFQFIKRGTLFDLLWNGRNVFKVI